MNKQKITEVAAKAAELRERARAFDAKAREHFTEAKRLGDSLNASRFKPDPRSSGGTVLDVLTATRVATQRHIADMNYAKGNVYACKAYGCRDAADLMLAEAVHAEAGDIPWVDVKDLLNDEGDA